MIKCVTCVDHSPAIKPGDHVHMKATFLASDDQRVRVGGAETHTITYVSDRWVGYTIHNQEGRSLGEYMMSRKEYEEEWEKCS